RPERVAGPRVTFGPGIPGRDGVLAGPEPVRNHRYIVERAAEQDRHRVTPSPRPCVAVGSLDGYDGTDAIGAEKFPPGVPGVIRVAFSSGRSGEQIRLP